MSSLFYFSASLCLVMLRLVLSDLQQFQARNDANLATLDLCHTNLSRVLANVSVHIVAQDGDTHT